MSLVASNVHISIPLFLPPPLQKIVNDSKRYVAAVSMIMPFKVLKYYSSGEISFFLFASLW